MTILVFLVLVMAFLAISLYLPKIIPSLFALVCLAFCIYIAYSFFGIWGALIVGIITVTASIFLSFKAVDFLDKYDIQIKRKK